MSVEITFTTDEGHGLVAEGTSLWEAAKRLGVSLRADCMGRGECDTCALLIIQGAELLSPVSDCELKILGWERLGTAERLACQTKLDQPGEVVVTHSPLAATAVSGEQSHNGIPGLPFKQKLGTFIESEATRILGAVNTLKGQSNALVEKFLNLKTPKPVTNQPPDHDAPPKNS